MVWVSFLLQSESLIIASDLSNNISYIFRAKKLVEISVRVQEARIMGIDELHVLKTLR